MKPLRIRGLEIWKSYLDLSAQQRILEALRPGLQRAPLFSPQTPYGKQMTVKMSSAGNFGWYSDSNGFRYIEQHPDGVSWPDIPVEILVLWQEVTGLSRHPECCLVNYYSEGARLGMHQDKDEKDFNWPVMSVSLGDDALFRIGNLTRGGKTESIWLSSGDVVVIGGDARLTYHGVDRIRFGSSKLLPKDGRINLTLRVVT